MLITLGRGMAPTSSTETTPFTLPPPAPSTDYYIVVLDGQSNMVGYGTPYDAQIDAGDPRILQLSRTGKTSAQKRLSPRKTNSITMKNLAILLVWA